MMECGSTHSNVFVNPCTAHSVWCINQNLHVLCSDSSLEVLLQHLSLQDVDARDNEVCMLPVAIRIKDSKI